MRRAIVVAFALAASAACSDPTSPPIVLEGTVRAYSWHPAELPRTAWVAQVSATASVTSCMVDGQNRLGSACMITSSTWMERSTYTLYLVGVDIGASYRITLAR